MSARRPIRTTQADCQIRGGEYVSYDRANYQTALKVWLDQAMAGSAEAQNNVGEIYSKGLGTEPDYGMAAQWFKKAADQGYNRAKINLGFLYEQGLGVTQDTAMALNLYREGSGLQDELLYASEVEVQFKEKDAQISGLQGQVQEAQADSAELREQVRQLQSQLAERRHALETSQRELNATQEKLAQAKASQDSGLSKLLENELLAQEQKISSQRTQIAALESRAAAGSGAIAARRFAADSRSHLRGDARPQHRGGARPGKRKLVGRVSNPEAVASISVNGQPAKLEANGTFSSDVDVAAAGPRSRSRRPTSAAAARNSTSPWCRSRAASPARRRRSRRRARCRSDVKLGRYYAVVIGNNTYRDAGYRR
jgi:peptidoglycan hydrolase CwlO-like protein